MFSEIHLVDDDHPAQAGLLGLVEHAAGVHLDARLGVDHDRRRVDAPHRADRLADEIGIAGRVDHVEVLAGVVEMHHGGFDRVLVVLLFFVEIADARAVVDAGQTLDRAGDASASCRPAWSCRPIRGHKRQCCECPDD